MLKPSINDLLKITGSRYSLVIITAKRARQITLNQDVENLADGNDFKDKPSSLLNVRKPDKAVKIAIDEIASGKIRCIKTKEFD